MILNKINITVNVKANRLLKITLSKEHDEAGGDEHDGKDAA